MTRSRDLRSHTLRCCVPVLTAVLALTPHVALGQVRDSLPPADSTVMLAPVVVTTSRLPIPRERAGLTIDVLDAQAIAARVPFSAIDLFRSHPGIFVDEANGPGGPTILRIRGGDEVFTQILVDGVQINQNGGFMDMLGLQFSNMDRVEIARGPQSAVNGSSAVSGVVHFVTPPGTEGDPQARVTVEGGGASDNGGRWRTEGSVRGGSDKFRYSAGAGTAFSRGIWALPNDTKSKDGSLRLDWVPSERFAAAVTARAFDMESMLPVRDPGVTRVALDPNARDSFDRRVVSATLRHAPSSRWNHALTFGWFSEEFVFEDQADGVTGPPDVFVFDANLLFVAGLRRTTARYSGTAALSPAVDVVWGGQWELEDLTNTITGDFEDNLTLDRSSRALFGEVGWSPTDQVTLLAGFRGEKYEDLDWDVTPRASASLRLAEGRLMLRTAVGRAFKAPNIQQQYVSNPFIAGNPDIRPETSISTEIGADVTSADRRVSLGITAFRQTFDDLIRSVGLEGTTQQINRNLGSARAVGLEWTFRAQATPLFALGSDGAWVSTEVLDNVGLSSTEYPIGERLPFRADVVGGLWAEFSDGPRWSARVRVSRTGSQDVLADRFSGARSELDGHTLAGISGSYLVRDGVRVYGRADNLLNTNYLSAFDRPGSPSTVLMGVELVF